jgi:predicted metal-dependent hydrolase
MRRGAAIRTEEVGHLELDGRPVPCLLRRSSARRTMVMRVDPQGRVVVNLPLRMPVSSVRDFFRLHSDWLRKQLAQVCRIDTLWREGSALPFLGDSLHLAEAPELRHPRRDGARLLVPSLTTAQDGVVAWYRAEALRRLDARLAAICRGIGRVEPAWRLSGARTRWGSLSVKGVVSLNWRLVKASQAEMDYVICHELAHFRQRNHSPAFWREVAALCPDYASARASLRSRSSLYFQF